MRRISVKGVLIGGIVDIVSSFALGLPFVLYMALKVDLTNTPTDHMESTITTAIHGNVPLYVGTTASWLGLLGVGRLCSSTAGQAR